MNQLDFNTMLLDNPNMMGVGSDNLINFGGGSMFGQVEKFRIKRNIMRDGVLLFKLGEIVKGQHSGKGIIRVPLKPKHRMAFNRKGVRLLIGKDVTPLVSNADGNDTDMLMGWALEDEVKSNAAAITSPIATKTATISETATPVLASPAPLPKETVTVKPAPTLLASPAPTTTAVAPPNITATITSTEVAAPKQSPITTDPLAPKPYIAPQPTTIIAPAILPAAEVIAPIPQVVVPATEVIPTSASVKPAATGGGGGGFMGGGGGGGSAAKKSEEGGEQKTAAGVVVAPQQEKKILGMKPMLFYSIVGLAALAVGVYAYKKYKTA